MPDTTGQPCSAVRTFLEGELQCEPGITWTKDIKPLFAADPDYIDHMLQVTNGKLNLGDYSSVKIYSSAILGKIQSGDMPPFPYTSFTPQQVNLFACWIQQGFAQ